MYKKILVPLDGSELAECVLPHVKNLTKDDSATEVTILNVFWMHIVPVKYWYGVSGYNEFKEKAKEASINYLADVESRLGSEGMKVVTESLEGGRPAHIISDYAQNNGMDLIVISSHGHTGIKKMMFGSVALEVLHSFARAGAADQAGGLTVAENIAREEGNNDGFETQQLDNKFKDGNEYKKKIAKQMMDVNKIAFDNNFNSMKVLLGQTKSIIGKFWEKAPVFPEEGKRAIADWMKSV